MKRTDMKYRIRGNWLSCTVALAVSLLAAWPTMATDDDVPFFAGRTGSPNVMILFDNSNSMQDSPYFRDDGGVYTPNTYWRRGVKINNHCDADTSNDDPADGVIVDGCIADSTPGVPGGSVRYNESAYIDTDNVLELPSQNPPNLPGLTTTESVVTSFQNRWCPAPDETLRCSVRIYDSNLDWSAISDWDDFVPYRYWKVKITDLTDNTVQSRSINSRNASAGYWTVSGDDLQYDDTHLYKYELVSEDPGHVTNEPVSSTNRVYDRNFDWSTVSTWSTFNSQYNHKILEVYAGTNAGERREIQWLNWRYGYWVVAEDFPVPCDYTTRYRILGALDDNKRAKGGNHPDSKMYQAKLALQRFLTSDAIKTTDIDSSGNVTERYLMNIGFATFLQARKPRTRALYYRKRAIHHPAYFRYIYRGNYSHSTNIYQPTGCVNGTPPTSATFDAWGETYTNMPAGGTVDRAYHSDRCDAQTIRYQVSYSCAPTDSLPDRVRIHLESNKNWTDPTLAGIDPEGNPQWGYTWIGWRGFEDTADTGDCESYTPPDPLWGSLDLVQPGETCYQDCQYSAAWDENPYYETTWHDTWGDLRISDPATPGYVETNADPSATYIVTPDKGYCSGDGWSCTTPDPEDTSGDGRGDWKLVEPADEAALTGVAINEAGDTGDIRSVIFDYSAYRYPGKNEDEDHPHGWSYRRTTNPQTGNQYKKDDGSWLDDHFIYRRSNSYAATWRDDGQPDPYFPSVSADEFTNFQGDDQVVFVDLPEYDDADAFKGDDVSGNNIQKVLNSINLARVADPKDDRYVWTMAPISKDALTVSTETAQAGNGTPLAATLADARKYFESYIAQDPYSLGGCRKNYIILLTDGNETAGGDPVAEAANLQHLVVNGEEHPVKVYVIGFGLDDASKATLDAIAEAGGGSLHGTPPDQHYAYFANNVEELVRILAHDITSDILGGSYGRGKATLTPGSLGVSSGLTLYNAYFDYPVWRGHLEAWQLYPEDEYDAEGTLLHRAGALMLDAEGNKVGDPAWSTGCSGTSPAMLGDPDAGCIMAEDNAVPGDPPDGPLSRRTLFTTTEDGERTDFDPAHVDAFADILNPDGDDINGDGAVNELDAKTIVNFIHHPGFDGASYVGTRDQVWPLADIYNSGPVLVTPPRKADCLDADNDGILDSGSWASMAGYCDFAEARKNRETMLYLGTNGGMVEAISAGTADQASAGHEKWGFVPRFVMPKLAEIRDGHRFTMDLSVMVSEVDTSDGLVGTDWRTMLVAGQRKGGNNYIALDVTDPDDPLPMWEFTDANLGQTWSRPAVARIEIEGVKTSVLIFGGGYSANADTGNRIYIVKAADGTILKEITVGAQANNIPGRIVLMPYLTDSAGGIVDYRTNLPQLPDGTLVDYSDRYNFIEVGYFGDSSGDIWRLDGLNSNSGETWNPHVTRLYHPDPEHARPIFYAPVIVDVKSGVVDNGTMTGCVARYILVGTGDEMNPIGTRKADFSPLIDYFFEVRDPGEPGSVADESNLDWRFSLGLQLPLDQYGFLLKPDGTRARKDENNNGIMDDDEPIILAKNVFLLNISNYISDGWSIGPSGQLMNSDNEAVALAGEYLFKDADGNLFADPNESESVVSAGSYVRIDTSLWLTDGDGWFYDSDDGTRILDTTAYQYDDDGYFLVGGQRWSAGGSTCDPVNESCLKIVSDPGEKVLAEPVGYGQYIYFTTYTPVGGCATGTSYFYGLKASSCDLAGGSGTLNYDQGGALVTGPRRRVKLGVGVSPGVTLGGGTAYVPLYSPGNPPDLNAIPVTVGETKLKYWRQN